MTTDFNSEELPEDELDSLLAELTDLVEPSPLNYVPHPKQKLFHQSTHKLRLLCGGNQSGKTESGAAEDVMHATGLYPDWYPEEGRIKGANKGRVVVTDFTAGAMVYEEKLWRYLPKRLVKNVYRTVHGSIRRIVIKHSSGGLSQIEMMTHEQDDLAFESWTGNWAHFDEPPPREKYSAMRRGLMALKGRCWFTLTPISQPWLYDEFLAKDTEEIFYLKVDIRDNPHVSEDEIKSFEATLTEDEKEARIHGAFKHLSGLVYKEFDPSVHVIPMDRIKMDFNWPTYFVTDPHDQKPHFGIWAKVDPMGTIYVIGEAMYKGTFKEYADHVLLREKCTPEWAIDPTNILRILDPNKGNTPSAVNGLKLKTEFANHGLYFKADVNDDIATGHLAVAERLRYDKTKPLDGLNHPKIYFIKEATPKCVEYFQKYTWSEWRGKAKDEKGLKEKPMEKYKDFPDCIRYLVMSNPVYFTNRPDVITRFRSGFTGYGR
jgi:hypothetical protein